MLESERAQERTTQQYYAQLRPFVRDTLETFASDSELYQYLHAAAFMRDTGVPVLLQSLDLAPPA